MLKPLRKAIASWRTVIRILRDRDGAEQDLDDEIRFHIEMETERYLREGHAPEEARRRAVVRFGGVERFKEDSRRARGTQGLEDFMNDLRFGLRMLAKQPLFYAAAIITLALGIGANTALYSVVRAVLLEPLPFDEPQELVRLYTANDQEGQEDYFVSPQEFADWRTMNRSFDELAAFWPTAGTLLDLDGGPVRANVVYTTDNYFTLLGAPALTGRALGPEDGPGSAQVALLSEGLWLRLFGGREEVVGERISLDGTSLEVVGVIPSETAYPEGTDLWTNMTWTMDIQSRGARWMSAVGRLTPTATVERSQTDMTAVAQRLSEEYPDFHQGWSVDIRSLSDEVVGDTRSSLWLLLGATGLILLIACANVGSLLLSRSEARAREIAVRAAFGAARARLARQLLTESVLLAVLGGVAGVALGWVALRLLLGLAPATIPRLDEVTLNGPVLAVSLIVTLATGLVFGLAPVARLLSGRFHTAIKEGGRGGLRQRSGLQRSFVVGQVALATVLVIGAGLLVRSFDQLRAVDTGFDPSGLLTFEVDVPSGSFQNFGEVSTFYEQFLSDLSTLQGVESVGATSSLPLQEDVDYNQALTLLRRQGPVDDVDRRAFMRQVSAGFFDALRIPVVSGRSIEESDRLGQLPVAVVNRTAVERLWGNENPIGDRIAGMGGTYGPLGFVPDTVEIVGVVEDVLYAGLKTDAQPAAYLHYHQSPFRRMSVTLRTSTGVEPASLVPQVRRTLATIRSDMPIANVQAMGEVVARARSRDRFATVLFGILGGVALALAVVGVYGVLAYSVDQRVPEVGLRMALGAEGRDVRGMILADGMRLTGLGLILGLAGAFASSSVISGMLFGVTARDPWVFVTVVAVLIGSALTAAFIPAVRATRVDPLVALRAK